MKIPKYRTLTYTKASSWCSSSVLLTSSHLWKDKSRICKKADGWKHNLCFYACFCIFVLLTISWLWKKIYLEEKVEWKHTTHLHAKETRSSCRNKFVVCCISLKCIFLSNTVNYTGGWECKSHLQNSILLISFMSLLHPGINSINCHGKWRTWYRSLLCLLICYYLLDVLRDMRISCASNLQNKNSDKKHRK